MTNKIFQTLSKAVRVFLLPLLCVVGSVLFSSCEETSEVDEYADWQERNIEFIDSIAKIAEEDADKKWLKILSFKLDDTVQDWGNEDYVYCEVIEQGTGTRHPLFTDSVAVNYRGRLIPTTSYPEGKIFDQSYKGELNPEVNIPAEFNVGKVIVGWSTALQQMVEGDVWRVYIPADLAYGNSNKQSGIPAYSALVFDINLVKIIQRSEE